MFNDLDWLIPPPTPGPVDEWGWATVTRVTPAVRVRLDGATSELNYTPINLAGPLHVGKRVWTQRKRLTSTGSFGQTEQRITIIHGPVTVPESPTIPQDNKVLINGTLYTFSGQIRNIPSFSYITTWAPVYVQSVNIPNPYRPPNGYRFEMSCSSTTGFTFVTTNGAVRPSGAYPNGATAVRIMQIGNSTSTAIGSVFWKLLAE